MMSQSQYYNAEENVIIFEHEETDDEAHSPEAMELEQYGLDYRIHKGTAAGD